MAFDQTAKTDYGKEQLTLVPTRILHAIARVRMFGSKKYKDPDNWKRVETLRYRDAAFRHFLAYLENPSGVDYESGLPHLWHLATNIAFLIELESQPMTCDRCPVKAANPYWCGYHDMECRKHREVSNGTKTGVQSGDEVARIDQEKRRRMS